MWISTAPTAEPLWQGELEEAHAAHGGEQQAAYRSGAAAGSADLQTPGPVSIGRPQVFEIASLYEKGKTPPMISAMRDQADIYLVQLSCSFRPKRGHEIDWATFAVSLLPNRKRPVVAVDLHPLNVLLTAKRKLKVGIKAELTFHEVAKVGASEEAGVEYEELLPTVTANGVGESAASWDYSKPLGGDISGSKAMHMIVRAPKDSKTLKASISLSVSLGARRFRLPFIGPHKKHVLENVQLWPPRD
jgi:hypothetical protein